MKSCKEMRAEAWRIVKSRWTWRVVAMYTVMLTIILAVTVLTSLDRTDLEDVGICGREPADQVLEMAKFATANGAHGLVCSPKEVGTLSKTLAPGTLFITPGVRPAGAAVGDQKRVATPADAVRDGATHLVVGRPILAAEDPVRAAAEILSQMKI